jgi:pseudaminic acid cytidylyltransferase
MDNKKKLAIIPVRAGSKRLVDKNIKMFDGKPLFIHTCEHAEQSNLFDEIHISTESEKVIRIANEYGFKTNFRRDEKLASDDAQLVDVCKYVLAEYGKIDIKFDEFCILWATTPLRELSDINKSYELLGDNVDAVVSVTEYDLPVYSALLIDDKYDVTPLFPDMIRLPKSKIPKVVCVSGNFCWVNVDAFHAHKTWLPPKLKGFEIGKHRSVDIDTQHDWDIAEYLYLKGKKNV